MNVPINREYDFKPVMSDNLTEKTWRMDCCGRLYCTQGNISVEMNGNVFHLVRNASLSLLPGSTVVLMSISEDFEGFILLYTYGFFQKASEGLEGLFPYYTLNPFIMRDDEAASDVIAILKMMQKLSEHTSPKVNERALCLMRFFLLGVCERAMQATLPQPVGFGTVLRPEEHFQRFIFEISSRYRTIKTVVEYASILGVTTKHLNVCCRKTIGKTAKECIDNFLLIQIKNELLHTTKSVAEIAMSFGFNESTEMCRFFKRLTDSSPAAYRMNGLQR